jgi:hypothetical protein
MAEVTVFVDDAVRGRLPGICAKDGTPTTDRLRVHERMGTESGLGVAWLLLLAGPLGWLGLVLVATMRGRTEVLSAELPYSEPAYLRMVAARRSHRTTALIATLSLLVLLLAAILPFGPLSGGRPFFALFVFTAGVGGFFTWMASRRLTEASVGLSLDASRRWVTLSRVHPAFAAAALSSHPDAIGRGWHEGGTYDARRS